jgi:hypothetical protein
MLTVMLIGLGLAVAIEPTEPPAGPGVKAPEAAAAPEDKLAAALAEYNALRAKTPQTAAAQWKLAVWCEANHLEAEAFAHFTAVVMLDPGREAAWRKLGFKKVHGRWMSAAQIADEAEQTKADKEWAPRLKKIHHEIHGRRKRAEASAALDDIVDPRAVSSVFREFGSGGTSDQLIAVQILGQIDAPLSSKLLAVLAVYGKTPEVRRRATETLRGRDADDYLAILVNLLSDPLKYEVRPVGGPGSPGVLFVEGERFNVRRFYDAPAPFLRFQPGDIVSYDENGLPAIIRPSGLTSSTLVQQTGTKKTGTTQTFVDHELATRYSLSEMLAEAQRGAISAQLQLQSDVAQIEALNDARTKFNTLVMNVAKDASGKDLGKESKDWRDALAAQGQGRYRKTSQESPRKPTIDELVPLAYLPRFGQLTMVNLQRIVTTPPDT